MSVWGCLTLGGQVTRREGLTLAVDVERLHEGAQVRFPGRNEVVSLIAVRPGPFWEFFFDGPSGPGKHVLAESELTGIAWVDKVDKQNGWPAGSA